LLSSWLKNRDLNSDCVQSKAKLLYAVQELQIEFQMFC
jgi:hypothetical protein